MRRKVDFFKYKIIGFAIREKQIVKRVGDKVQDEKMRRTITETDNGLTFFLLFVNIQILTCSLPTKEIFFIYTAKIGPQKIFRLSIFRSQPREIPLPRSRT